MAKVIIPLVLGSPRLLGSLKSPWVDSNAVLVRKSLKQRFTPDATVMTFMESFKQMTNECIRIGLANDASTLRRLSTLSYQSLKRFDGYSQYRLTAISKAAGILAARKKSIKRGFPTKTPYLSKPILTCCYGFRIEDGCLLVHTHPDALASIPLNSHTLSVLSDPTLKVRSFTLTERSLSLCVSKEVHQMEAGELTNTVGVDRNLRNITVGNQDEVRVYGTSEAVEIAERTRSVMRSFKRNDSRVKGRIWRKNGMRRSNRTKQILHHISKDIVARAKTDRQAIVFEDIRGIRSLYRKGNGQGRNYRSRLNSAPWGELKRQVEYKAAWEGVPVLTLTKDETRGTTMDCPRCGERLQAAARGDGEHYRQLWCQKCGRWMDRDIVAVLNISRRGWVRFAHPTKEGEAREAVRGNQTMPVILRVDASKRRPS